MSAGQEHNQLGASRDRGDRDDRKDQDDRKDRPRASKRLGPLPRPLAFTVLGLWALLTIVAVAALITGPSPWSGALDELVPELHRSSEDRTLILLRVKLDELAQRDAEGDETPASSDDAHSDPRTVLTEAGFAIEEAFASERVPLAPPKTEITRWLDAHALYLLPIDTHAALASRLTDASMLSEVQGLEARLSSPLFPVSGDQPRRDPLGIHELTKREAGRLGHVAEAPGSNGAQVSASGDLIGASGDRALIGLISDRPITELRAELDAAVEGLPVAASLIDPRIPEARVAERLDSAWVTALATCFAALILLLSVTMRRVIPVLALCLCLASAWALLLWATVSLELGGGPLGLAELEGGMGLPSFALAILLLGFGCDPALRLQKIGRRGLASTLIMALALVPLALSPYPLWQRWALWWLLAYLVLALIMGLVLPALLELLRGDFDWRRPGFRLTPMPALAVLVCLGLGAAGAWVTPLLRYRSPARLPSADVELHERELIEHFFDPTMIVTATTKADSGPDGERPPGFETPAAAALDAAALTSAQLALLVPTEARRVDSPGSFVLPRSELEARRQALTKLKLDQRMEALRVLLVDQGLRAEAFAEFVRGAADIDDLPSAQAALDGPLGPWISAYLVSGDKDTDIELRARVELRGREGLPREPLSESRLAELPTLRGPAIAAMIDQREFLRRLGLVVIAGLWLTTFFVWLGTGSLGIALATAVVAIACECGVMVGLSLLDQPTGPHLLPVVILVGASAGVAGGRACRAVSLGQAIVARGLLLTGGCQIIAGGVLLISAQPLWRELGLAIAIGSALACGLGLFVTPGLASLFGKLRGSRAPGRPSKGSADS